MANTDNSNNFWWQIRVLVFSGLVVAALTTAWLTDTLHFVTNIIKGVWHYFAFAISWLFTSWYNLPAGLIVLLVLLSLVAIIQNWPKRIEVTQDEVSPVERYTRDVIYDGEWNWSYFRGGIILQHVCCPKCKTPMAPLYDFDLGSHQRKNWFKCETCGHATDRIQGNADSYEEAVRRQIQGKINRGEFPSAQTRKSP